MWCWEDAGERFGFGLEAVGSIEVGLQRIGGGDEVLMGRGSSDGRPRRLVVAV